MPNGKPRYALWVQELAHWVASPSRFTAPLQKYTGDEVKKVFELVDGQKGIIFFQNDRGTNRQGDHIDVWNGKGLTARFSWFRAQWGISWDGVWSDFTLAHSVWFWRLS